MPSKPPSPDEARERLLAARKVRDEHRQRLLESQRELHRQICEAYVIGFGAIEIARLIEVTRSAVYQILEAEMTTTQRRRRATRRT